MIIDKLKETVKNAEELIDTKEYPLKILNKNKIKLHLLN